MEVLACVESAEAVVAAVQSGADAIYIRFGGKGVHGFTEDALGKSVRYCRVRGCRVYAMLDTLMADSEAAAAAALARRACELGVDALIAQDLGFISVARSVAPDMPVFAGERLGLHNTAGIEAVRQLGVSRVFLPGELPLSEIRALASRTGVELAVLVMGEQCAARAGLCWLSALTGGGSANRGSCSRVCSEKYSLGGRMDDYPLATKPVSLLHRIPELAAAGVASAVIHADRPERLAAAVSLCSACTRGDRVPSRQEDDHIEEIFAHREFTDACLDGNCAGCAGGSEPLERDDERAADRAMSSVRRGYANRELRRVKVEFVVAAKPGRPLLAGIRDMDGNSVQYKGPVVSSAPGEGITNTSVSDELRRTKGTPYHCDRVVTYVAEGCRVPPGTLNSVRRGLVHALTKKRAVVPKRRVASLAMPSGGRADKGGKPEFCVEVRRAAQLSEELAELKPACLYLPLGEIAAAAPMLERFTANGTAIAAVLPRVIHDGELTAIGELLERARGAGVTQALVGNLGHVALVRMAGMEARGDYGLNIFNSWALADAADAGLLSVTASFELSLAKIRALVKPVDVEIIGYGRLPAMLTERCIIEASARRCVCENGAKLSDGHGRVMPVEREYVCRNAVYGPEKVYMADKMEELAAAGVRRFRALFTNEGTREVYEVMRSCMGLSSYRPNGLTRGFYVKGVE